MKLDSFEKKIRNAIANYNDTCNKDRLVEDVAVAIYHELGLNNHIDESLSLELLNKLKVSG
ncbi:hypothetical protein [Chrysiogenes arsenatis]|uniref:hypothetical protein n=1 Tax=Chrysiogenes arsenatis TaxID=309797 RepID=UPI00048791BD|nr:hypothetical protein [Chrysiogenes arsenatis]